MGVHAGPGQIEQAESGGTKEVKEPGGLSEWSPKAWEIKGTEEEQSERARLPTSQVRKPGDQGENRI